MIRVNLLTPAGDFVSAETYNRLFTMHGIVMIFFFLIPSIPTVLGNFLIPIMIGARDVAFPKLNLLSWYIYMLGGSFTMFAVLQGGVDTGWTFYAPYSTTYSNTYVVVDGSGRLYHRIFVHLDRSEFHRDHPPDACARNDMVQAAAVHLVAIFNQPDSGAGHAGAGDYALCWRLESIARVGIFDPEIGGDPILFQHLFWFYSHPAVYIMILPGMGVISELVTASREKGSSAIHS